MNRLEQLHKAYEAQQPNKDGWTFTKDILPPRDPDFGYSWVENSALDIKLVKEYNDNDELSWRRGSVHTSL